MLTPIRLSTDKRTTLQLSLTQGKIVDHKALATVSSNLLSQTITGHICETRTIPTVIYESMSPADDKEDDAQESSESAPASRTSSRGSTRGSGRRRSQGAGNIIEFVDSQDPNVKSAIQRHTAYHSAAQRREQRLRSLRRGSQSRYLEWGRRPVSEPPATSPTRGSSSTSAHWTPETSTTTPASITATDPPQLLGRSLIESLPGSRSLSPQVPLSAEEESIIELYLQNTCESIRTDPLLSTVIIFIRCDEACTQLLLAYSFAFASVQIPQRETGTAEQDVQAAERYLGRGTNLLWNRLRDSDHASSDANIQAVLLLVAYTSDFAGNEVYIHADALRTMVAQRAGATAITNTPLRYQLASLDRTLKFHLTLAPQHDCRQSLRYPGGFWSSTPTQEDAYS